MIGFGRGSIRPAFVTAPAEPDLAAHVEEIDRHLRAIALIPTLARTEAEWSSLDVLLDRRNRLLTGRAS